MQILLRSSRVVLSASWLQKVFEVIDLNSEILISHIKRLNAHDDWEDISCEMKKTFQMICFDLNIDGCNVGS